MSDKATSLEFDALEALVAALAKSDQAAAMNLSAGFARGTGGIDRAFVKRALEPLRSTLMGLLKGIA